VGVFVYQSAEPIAAWEVQVGGCGRGQWSKWCCLKQCAVGAMVIEVGYVLG
jgi:hypothetical protein